MSRPLPDNPAAVFDQRARAILADIECDNAEAEGRPVRKRAFGASEVARIVGASPSQWHGWTSGQKSPSYRTVVGWLVRWEAAGYPPLTVTISSRGASVRAS